MQLRVYVLRGNAGYLGLLSAYYGLVQASFILNNATSLGTARMNLIHT